MALSQYLISLPTSGEGGYSVGLTIHMDLSVTKDRTVRSMYLIVCDRRHPTMER